MASATPYLRLPAKTTTDKLQRVLNAAARVVSNTGKFDRGLSQLLHDDYTGWTFLTELRSS